jgi:hypothetical protein
MNVSYEEKLMKLGAARSKEPTAWRLVDVTLGKQSAALSYSLNRGKLRIARRREGRYLLRTNLTDQDPPFSGSTTFNSSRSRKRSRT